MTKQNDMNEIAAKSLGSANSYAVFTDKFDPSLLNPMPRSIARDHWGIKGDSMKGADVWHCHEATFMLDNGCPVSGTLKFVYSSESEYMVESKSAKLYLNSFDMCRMGATLEAATKAYEDQIKKDLSACVQHPVKVKFHNSRDWNSAPNIDLLLKYDNIEVTHPEIYSHEFTDFTGQSSHVRWNVVNVDRVATRFYTNALRSRCRHTKQKDTGLAAIEHISSTDGQRFELDMVSAFEQIVSLREVNEFHEFCAEKLYMEIKNSAPADDKVGVMLLYSRRGSLDINPVRATEYWMLDADLIDANVLTVKVQGQ